MSTVAATRSKTYDIVYIAVFAVIMAICSWISIPLPGTSVPINLATFAVILAGLMLGSRDGAIAMLVFLALGAIGVPVFHSFTGGMGIVFGPTGGFLIGYIALAFFAGLAAKESEHPVRNYILFTVIGEVVLYALGSVWFIFQAGSNIQTALMACVVPFLPGDAVKMVLAYLVAGRLKKVIA